jgi:DNA-binding transcriptional LysR family regulator
LRYFAAVAGAGTFTRAAEQVFIAQPALSQQIRRLEQIIGTPLLQRLRDGVRLTAAGTVLLDAARDVLSLVDHGVSQARQAAGLGRQRLRVATADRPAAVLTGPAAIAGAPPDVITLPRATETPDMVQVSIAGHPLTATAALVWTGDLPRSLQQILFDTAVGATPPAPVPLSRAG